MSLFGRLFGRNTTQARTRTPRAGVHTPASQGWRGGTPTPTPIPPTQEPARRFLHNTAYLLPKDGEEENRLNFQHHSLYLTLGNHYLAPLPQTVRLVVDSGCGTGIWPGDMARSFPGSLMLGLDKDPASFSQSVPENCLLRQGDILAGLPLPDQVADYTHQRFLVLAIPDERWPAVVRELVRITRPGGWIELVETDARVREGGPATEQMFGWLDQVRATRGLHGTMVTRLADLLRAEGVQEIETMPITLKVGTWGERAGAMMECDILAGVQALKQPCVQLGIDAQVFDGCLEAMKQEWKQAHAFAQVYVAYGRRGTA